jgi:hypothetical protein
MGIGNLFRNIIEIGFGVLYLVGVIFNSLYTLRHGDEFYGSFADKALLIPLRQIVRKMVIPRTKPFYWNAYYFSIIGCNINFEQR